MLKRSLPLVIVGIIFICAVFQLLPIAAVRVAASIMLILQVYQERRTGKNLFLTSPLFLLGAISIIFFSLLPAVSDTSFPGSHIKDIETYFGSDAERMFIIFGACCIAAHSIISSCPDDPLRDHEKEHIQTGKPFYLFASIALMVSLVNVLNFRWLDIAAVRSVAPPVMAFCLLYLVYQATGATKRKKLLVAGVVILSIASLLFVQEGKKPIFIIVAGLLFWLRLKNVSTKNLVIFGVASIFSTIVLVQVVQMIRAPFISISTSDGRTPALMFKEVLVAKAVLRQTETRYCFHNVIDKHWEQSFVWSDQLFWLKGLVPRILWPEKPDLSSGEEYAKTYCGIKYGEAHSASISLLGEPVIHGGRAGLIVHGGFLILCLGGLVWFSRNPRTLSAITAAALLPWLIDFDQNFTLYVANVVKFFLVMLPFMYLTGMTNKRLKPD